MGYKISYNTIIGQATLLDVPFKANRVSEMSGPLFGTEGTMTLSLNMRLLDGEHNKSELIDSLIQGRTARIQCPHCGKVFTIKTE